jgi:4-hydroxy-tetrahydrodipicolinate reductase
MMRDVMANTRICIAGITGWVGSALAEAVRLDDGLDLVSGIARSAAGTVVHGAPVYASVSEALAVESDVFVDYTTAEAVKGNVLEAIAAGRHVVVGSSGLSDSDYADIDSAARHKRVGVVAVGNFAVSAGLLNRFAQEAAKLLPAWEIIDYAHDSKPDAPSGTARELAWSLSQVGTSHPAIAPDASLGPREVRGATVSGTQIHSLRLPGHTIGVEVIFGREDERLSIRYEGGTGAGPYINGTLLAIRKAPQLVGLARGLAPLL